MHIYKLFGLALVICTLVIITNFPFGPLVSPIALAFYLGWIASAIGALYFAKPISED